MILAHHEIATAPFCVARNDSTATEIIALFGSESSTLFPLFVKPVAEGSSKGVRPDCKVAREADLQSTVNRLREQYPQQDILIEKFLSGREFTVGIVGTGAKARVIGATEFHWKQPKNHSSSGRGVNGGTSLPLGVDFYTLELKRNFDLFKASVACVPADLERDIEAQKACQTALAAYRILECRDVGRIDVRADIKGSGAVPHIMEVGVSRLHETQTAFVFFNESPAHESTMVVAISPQIAKADDVLGAGEPKAGTPTQLVRLGCHR